MTDPAPAPAPESNPLVTVENVATKLKSDAWYAIKNVAKALGVKVSYLLTGAAAFYVVTHFVL